LKNMPNLAEKTRKENPYKKEIFKNGGPETAQKKDRKEEDLEFGFDKEENKKIRERLKEQEKIEKKPDLRVVPDDEPTQEEKPQSFWEKTKQTLNKLFKEQEKTIPESPEKTKVEQKEPENIKSLLFNFDMSIESSEIWEALKNFRKLLELGADEENIEYARERMVRTIDEYLSSEGVKKSQKHIDLLRDLKKTVFSNEDMLQLDIASLKKELSDLYPAIEEHYKKQVREKYSPEVAIGAFKSIMNSEHVDPLNAYIPLKKALEKGMHESDEYADDYLEMKTEFLSYLEKEMEKANTDLNRKKLLSKIKEKLARDE